MGTSTLVGPSRGTANLVGPSNGPVNVYGGATGVNGDDGSSGIAGSAAAGALAAAPGLYSNITLTPYQESPWTGGTAVLTLSFFFYSHRCPWWWWCWNRWCTRWTRCRCCCDQRTIWRHPRRSRPPRSHHQRRSSQVLDVLRPHRSRLGDGGKPTTVTYRSQTILKRAQRSSSQSFVQPWEHGHRATASVV